MLEVGREAPIFALADSVAQLGKLEDFRGQKVLLWFYPKGNTPG